MLTLLTLLWYVGTKEDDHLPELMASTLGSEDNFFSLDITDFTVV